MAPLPGSHFLFHSAKKNLTPSIAKYPGPQDKRTILITILYILPLQEKDKQNEKIICSFFESTVCIKAETKNETNRNHNGTNSPKLGPLTDQKNQRG